jgi:hypothetical protein
MPLQNSWLAHLHAVNENDTANKNFDAFVNAMEAKNSKNDKIVFLTKTPTALLLLPTTANGSSSSTASKNLGAPAPTWPLQWGASWAMELEPYQLQSTWTMPHPPSRLKSLQSIKSGDAGMLKH